MKWGIDFVDSFRFFIRFEFFFVGYVVYWKFGFEDVDVLDMKVKEIWGVIKEEGWYWGENNVVVFVGLVFEGVMWFVIMRWFVKCRGSVV